MYCEDDYDEEEDTPVATKRTKYVSLLPNHTPAEIECHPTPSRSELSQSAMHQRSPSPALPIPVGQHAKPSRPNRRQSNPLPARSLYQKVSPVAIAPSPASVVGTSSQTTPALLQPAPSSSKQTLPSSVLSQQTSIPQSHMSSRASVASPPMSLPTQVPGTSSSQIFPLATNHLNPQQSSASADHMLHALNSAYQFQNAASQTLTQLVETIIMVAQRSGMDTAVIQNYLTRLPMPSSLHSPTSSLAPQTLHAHSNTSPSSSERPVPPISDSPPVDQSPSSIPTSRRPVSHESPPPVKKRKKFSQVPQVKKAAAHSQQYPSEAVSQPQTIKGIFSTKAGQPILIFVQIDTRGRHEIVHLIKVSLQA